MDKDDRYTRITLRIPKDLHSKLSDAADETSKSMNAEIIARLEESFEQGKRDDTLASTIADLARDLDRLTAEIHYLRHQREAELHALRNASDDGSVAAVEGTTLKIRMLQNKLDGLETAYHERLIMLSKLQGQRRE
ncbi:Arc family DNA-binding protein [Pseudomonas sp. GD03855]|nr:Arc family DNA-binding protein [Pseudomonas sp. GD03856]MDH2263873.1 Arc family DNA-binding protein [Pseudomonas sp. GD03855]